MIVNQSWKPFCQKCDIHTSQRQTEITIHKTPRISSSTHKINTASCWIFHQIIQFTPEGELKSKYSELSLSYNSWESKNGKDQEAKLVSDQITSLVEQYHTRPTGNMALDAAPHNVPSLSTTSPMTALQFINTTINSPVFSAIYLCFSYPECEFYSICGLVGFFDHSFSFSKLPWALIFLFSVLLERLWI